MYKNKKINNFFYKIKFLQYELEKCREEAKLKDFAQERK
jgi:hypothetical protein